MVWHSINFDVVAFKKYKSMGNFKVDDLQKKAPTCGVDA